MTINLSKAQAAAWEIHALTRLLAMTRARMKEVHGALSDAEADDLKAFVAENRLSGIYDKDGRVVGF